MLHKKSSFLIAGLSIWSSFHNATAAIDDACGLFQRACTCPGATWQPQTTLTIKRDLFEDVVGSLPEASCSGGCDPFHCVGLEIFGGVCSRNPDGGDVCGGPLRLTRELDSPGYIHTYLDHAHPDETISQFFTRDVGQEGCLSGFLGQDGDGFRYFSTVIIQPGHTVHFHTETGRIYRQGQGVQRVTCA